MEDSPVPWVMQQSRNYGRGMDAGWKISRDSSAFSALPQCPHRDYILLVERQTQEKIGVGREHTVLLRRGMGRGVLALLPLRRTCRHVCTHMCADNAHTETCIH